ncbi:MAG: beta-ketoacyl-ACP synthase III [Candidatus Dasytiphilus stammeri]
MYTSIIGTGSYLPEKIVTNADLEERIHYDKEWIVSTTGIHKRHIADIKDSVASMAFRAAERAIFMAGIDKNAIGLIIVATTTSRYVFPSSACIVQNLLGINKHCVAAFDVAAACTGFIYAISIADQYIKNGMVKYALVIGSDILSHRLDPNDPKTIILFGDGAGAVVLGFSKKPGILSTHLHADGRYGDLLKLPGSGHISSKYSSSYYLTMEGKKLFKIAINKLRDLIDETLKLNNIKAHALDWIIPHQANLRIINATIKKLGLNQQKVIITLDRYGNTSSASIPTALDEAVRDGRIQQKQLILLEAFGAGLTWGSALIIF